MNFNEIYVIKNEASAFCRKESSIFILNKIREDYMEYSLPVFSFIINSFLREARSMPEDVRKWGT